MWAGILGSHSIIQCHFSLSHSPFLSLSLCVCLYEYIYIQFPLKYLFFFSRQNHPSRLSLSPIVLFCVYVQDFSQSLPSHANLE